MSGRTSALPAGVADAVRARLGSSARVEIVGAFDYATTNHAIELEVELECRYHRLLFKDLRPEWRLPPALGRRPGFVDDPGREVLVYRSPLVSLGLTPDCWATSAEPGAPWLLLEKVDGRVLWQVDAGPLWDRAAATLARLHGAHVERLLPTPARRRLVRHDERFHRTWAERALAAPGGDGPAVRHVVQRASVAVRLLLELPTTLIHGEAYASNLLVDRGGGVLLVDWELAGLGPGVSDLAALVAGWDEATVARLATTYVEALPDAWPRSSCPVTLALDAARLAHCIQWLGWSEGWQPPTEHARDWLATGLELAERMPT